MTKTGPSTEVLSGQFALLLLGQDKDKGLHRLETYMNKRYRPRYQRVLSDPAAVVLCCDLYLVSFEAFDEHKGQPLVLKKTMVLDDGARVSEFEAIGDNLYLEELTTWIRNDFVLDHETAPVFEDMLDLIYPVASWKFDKREYFEHDNGKWYFLRDAYFRTKQGFEVDVDGQGHIIGIHYKMKWNDTLNAEKGGG